MRLGNPLPSLQGATDSFHAEGFRDADLQGHPVLIHFWAVSCHLCHEAMPEVIACRDRYRDQALKVVGVHMPKEPGDLDLEKVKRDIVQYHLSHAILVDNRHTITDRFQNQFVPAFYLFDRHGALFFRAAGDKGLQNLATKLEQMLAR